MSERDQLQHAYELAQRDLEIARLRLEVFTLRETVHDLWPKKTPADRVEEAPAIEAAPAIEDAPAASPEPPPAPRPRRTEYDGTITPSGPLALPPNRQREIKDAIRAFPDASYKDLREITGAGVGTIARYKKIVAQEDEAAQAAKLPTLDDMITDRSGLPPYRVEAGLVVPMGAQE